MKEEKERITLCQGTGCPLAESCAFYCPTLDPVTTDHWSPVPYGRNSKRSGCFYYEEIEIDLPPLVTIGPKLLNPPNE